MQQPSTAEAAEQRDDHRGSTFLLAGLRLPRCAPYSLEGAAGALVARPATDDLVLSSYPGCDCRQVDAIVWRLLYSGLSLRIPLVVNSLLPCMEMEAWKDAMSPVHERATRHKLPRLFKTYLPFRLVPFYRRAKYIYVIRSPWDACAAHYEFLTSIGALTCDFDAFFADFMEGGVPYGSYFRHVTPWNKRVAESNILILCREHVEHNPRSALYKIAAFLGGPYLQLLMSDDALETDILKDISDIEGSDVPIRNRPRCSRGDRATRRPVACSEQQLNEIVRKMSQQFGNSSLEFLWLNLLQKQLPAYQA